MYTFIVRRQSSVSTTGSFLLLLLLYLFSTSVTTGTSPTAPAVTRQYFLSGFTPISFTGLVRVLTALEDTGPSETPTYSAIALLVLLKLVASFAIPCLYVAQAGPVASTTVVFFSFPESRACAARFCHFLPILGLNHLLDFMDIML